MSYKPYCVVRAPVTTRSGYGEMSRDIVSHLIEKDEYEIEVHSINWGNTPMNALDPDNKRDAEILKRIVPERLTRRPDLYISISIPTEFRPFGKYNIGITAGIETTLASPQWIMAINQMDVTFAISNHAKNVFVNSKFEQKDQNGNRIGIVELQKPVEVLHNCVDTYTYKKISEHELEPAIKKTLDEIPEDFNFLFVGHWLTGGVGEDRKNIGLLVNIFYDLFKRAEFKNKPGLILKTNSATFSVLDREDILRKIRHIKNAVELEDGQEYPNIYLLHGDLTDSEMNSLFNHPKVKAHISLTHGEGFGRPLLEASLSGKPIITTGWSGHLDFLDSQSSVLIGGELKQVPQSVVWENVIIPESAWLEVDPNMSANAMIEVMNHYNDWKSKAKDLAKRNKENFNYKAIRKQFWDLLDKYVPEFEEEKTLVNLKLPELKKKNTVPQLNLPKLKKNIED